jgi:uncharacterized protein DUF6282
MLPVGAVDLHCHAGPSLWPRPLDSREALRLAAEAGMAAIVLKDHHRATFMEAQLLNASSPAGWPQAVGGVALNHSQGALSPCAVGVALKLGARVVWMPTVSAAHHKRLARDGHPIFGGTPALRQDGPALTVLARDGRLLPEVDQILSLVAEAGAALATGHLSIEEALAVTVRANEHGVHAVLVNHPTILGAAEADLRALSRSGAIVEHEASMLLPESRLHSFEVDELLRWIEIAGLASTVIASDLGQVGNPLPAEGLARAVELLRSAGLDDESIRSLVVVTPRRILNL